MSESTRSYESPVRDRQKAETCQSILDAVVPVLLDQGIHAFTVRNVAAQAGVAYRTVYRYFPTREALLLGLWEHFEERWAASPLASPPPATADDLLARIEGVFRFFEAHAAATRALVLTLDALGVAVPSRASRTTMITSALAASYPRLPASDHARAGAIIHTLGGSRNWVALTSAMGLSPQAALDAVLWAITALLADLARRNTSAEPSAEPSRESR